MAGLTEVSPQGVHVSAAPWSRFARAQYAAMASMRWRMFRNAMRSTRGALEAGTRIVLLLLYCSIGLGLAASFGGGAYAIVVDHSWEFLPVLFWGMFLLWQIIPISMASFQQQFDLAGLLRFPLGFSAYFVLHLIFGLIDASTILGVCCCVGVFTGVSLARPSLSAMTALGLFLFAVFNIVLVRAIFAWIDRWLAKRRSREILGAAFLAVMLGVQFFNPALRGNIGQSPLNPAEQAEALVILHRAGAVQRWLPPGLASQSIRYDARGNMELAAGSLLLLGLYAAVTGAVLALRLRAQFRGESLGEAPAQKEIQTSGRKWLLDGSGPISAVLEKELRILLRAMPLLYALAAPFLMVFIFSGLFRNGGVGPGHLPLGLLACLGYATLGFTQLIYNNLGAEGPGIQIMFIAPTPVRTVMLAKNLFHGSLYVLEALLVFVLASLRYGNPGPVVSAAVLGWVLFSLPVQLAVGNLFSVLMPYRMNLSRISRQQGSQSSVLLSMLVQMSVLALGTAVFFVCSYLGRLAWAFPVFLILAAIAFYAWLRVLANADGMAARRRELLVSVLVKAE